MTVTVDFTQLHPAAHATWTAIARLVTATNTRTWAVVGGQMVAIHATVWGVEVPRATDDGDIVVDVRMFTRNALRHVAGALVADGFDSEQSPEGVVRFVKGDAKIDLLAPDGLGADPVETGKGRVVQAPGATQAVERAETIVVELASERFQVRTPNLLGAIVAKSAAATEVVSATRFDREKHERDLATLLTCAARDPKLEQMASAMTKKDRRRLTAASRAFTDDTHPCWSDGADRSDIDTVLELLLE
jgi:hypothetical protein